MKLVIISDIHDNQANLLKCQDWCQRQRVEATLCCGDIANTDTLSLINSKLPSPIYMVRGNAELFEESLFSGLKNIKYLGSFGRINIAGKWVGLCHEPNKIDSVVGLGKCDFIFYGHTHKPWEEKKDAGRMINPGNIAGFGYKATFAFWDTEKVELKLILVDEL